MLAWSMAKGKRWTRDELLIARNLYHKLTFGQMHARQPAIIALADKMGRGANSLTLKLVNLASLDPALQMRGIVVTFSVEKFSDAGKLIISNFPLGF